MQPVQVNQIIIAIDGYSACGKSTLAKALSKKLNIRYIDSGAMYRAVTLYFIQNGIPVPGRNAATDFDYSQVLNNIHIDFKVNPDTGYSEIMLNDLPVEKQIRQMDVSENVSHVSTIKAVRQRMVHLQQQMKHTGGLVMDGRDIGTAVFPDAHLKIFMTAHPSIRAERRFNEFKKKGIVISLDEVAKNLEARDYEDTHRAESPLVKADDAIVVDNSHLSETEQVALVLDLVNEKLEAII